MMYKFRVHLYLDFEPYLFNTFDTNSVETLVNFSKNTFITLVVTKNQFDIIKTHMLKVEQ